MKVAEFLANRVRFVATIAPERSVTEALAALAHHQIGALVVSEDGRSLGGIVSERDIVRHLAIRGPAILAAPVSAIMSPDVYSCSPSDDLESLMDVMTTRRFRHVPVLEGDVLVGIVSIGDVVKARVDQLEGDRQALTDFIYAR